MNTYPDIDDCSAGPCIHGACQDQVHGYICHCDLFHGGETCHQRIPLLQFDKSYKYHRILFLFATTNTSTVIIPSCCPKHHLQTAQFLYSVLNSAISDVFLASKVTKSSKKSGKRQIYRTNHRYVRYQDHHLFCLILQSFVKILFV